MKHTTLIAGALLALTVPATAQAFQDNFDAYANGTVLNGVGGWKGWDNNAAVAGVVTNARRISLPNSMQLDGSVQTDAVHPGSNATSGKWLLTLKQRIELGDLGGGNVYVIGNSVYNDGGPYTWTIQISATNSGTIVNDDIRGGNLPVIYNRWVEYCIIIDLDNDTCTTYYDGQLLSSGTYSNGGPVVFDNLDLYSSGGACNFDDVNFRPAGTFTNYGTGLAGSGGITPTITGADAPNVGKKLKIEVGSGIGGGQGVLLLGTAQLSFPFFGGTLLVLPDLPSLTYTLDGAGNGMGTKTLSIGIPNNPNLAGANVYGQALTIDAGAAQGISFTDGLCVTIGQ